MIKISNLEGTLTAEIDPVGGALSKLIFNDRQVIGNPDEYSGVVLFPWPNRIIEGTWSFFEVEHSLSINHSETNSALHGLLYNKLFATQYVNSERVDLFYSSPDLDGYPFSFELLVSYRISRNELICKATVMNADSESIPFALGFHPYFLVTETAIFESSQTPLPGESFPEGLFQNGHGVQSSIQELKIDQTLNGSVKPISKIVDQMWTAEIHQSNLAYTHVFTNRYSEESKLWFAIEPQSAPANSLKSGEGLTILEAGQQAIFEYGVVLIKSEN